MRRALRRCVRGKWVLDNLLGAPPPPPLPDVPALKDNTVDGNLSVRKRLAEHRSNADVRQLPQLDGSGRLVAREIRRGWPLANGLKAAMPIDASGGLPDGSAFADVDGLEAALLRRPELFVGDLHRKAADLRARAAASSTTTRRQSAPSSATRGRRATASRRIVLGVVKSEPFQMRKSR